MIPRGAPQIWKTPLQRGLEIGKSTFWFHFKHDIGDNGSADSQSPLRDVVRSTFLRAPWHRVWQAKSYNVVKTEPTSSPRRLSTTDSTPSPQPVYLCSKYLTCVSRHLGLVNKGNGKVLRTHPACTLASMGVSRFYFTQTLHINHLYISGNDY